MLIWTPQDSQQSVNLWVPDIAEVESSALNQIKLMSQLPILGGHIAIMPDVHCGKGATIGSVVPTLKAIVPATVGVDLACGVLAAQTNLTANDLPQDLKLIRHRIESVLPVGFNSHRDAYNFKERHLQGRLTKLKARIKDLAVAKYCKENVIGEQIGTMGGGK